MKKIVAFLVSCSIAVSLAVPAFAAVQDGSEYEQPSSLMAVAIERDRQIMLQDLKEQLEKQDALDKLDRFTYLIDETIQAKYYPSSLVGLNSRATKYAAYNGGWYKATSTYADTEAQYLNKNQTAVAKAERTKPRDTFIASLAAAGLSKTTVIGGAGALVTIYSIASAALDWLRWGDITAGQDCVYIIASYDKLDLTTTTVVWKWSNYPYMTVGDNYSTITDFGIN